MSLFGITDGAPAAAQVAAFLLGAVLLLRLTRVVLRMLGLGA